LGCTAKREFLNCLFPYNYTKTTRNWRLIEFYFIFSKYSFIYFYFLAHTQYGCELMIVNFQKKNLLYFAFLSTKKIIYILIQNYEYFYLFIYNFLPFCEKNYSWQLSKSESGCNCNFSIQKKIIFCILKLLKHTAN
jgi:hypothetical protein